MTDAGTFGPLSRRPPVGPPGGWPRWEPPPTPGSEPSCVEIWEVLADGRTGRFLGWGTAVGLRLVVAHPATTATLMQLSPAPPAPTRRFPPGGLGGVSTTRTLDPGALGPSSRAAAPQVDSPQVDAAARGAGGGRPGPRVRCRARTLAGFPGARAVVDGTLRSAFVAPPRGPYAVDLDGQLDSPDAPLPLPLRGQPVDLDAVNAFLAERARHVPPAPASPPPSGVSPANPGGASWGFSPPWCALFPGCWGCG